MSLITRVVPNIIRSTPAALQIPGCVMYHTDLGDPAKNFEFNIGTQVKKWIDLSGYENHSPQSVSVSQPVYVGGKLNFNGQQVLDCSLKLDWANIDYTVVAVAKSTAFHRSSGIISNRFGAGGSTQWWSMEQSYYLPNGWIDTLIVSHTGGGANTPSPLFSNISTKPDFVAILDSTSAELDFRVNKSVADPSGYFATGGLTNDLKIGQANVSLLTKWIGTISSVSIFTHKLTEDERTFLMNDLSARHGFPLT